MKGIQFIYNKLKDTYDLTVTRTAALNEGYTIDVPVICGKTSFGKFELYKDEEMFVFSVEYFDKNIEDKYTHGHLYDVNSAISFVRKFMAGKSIFEA